MTERHWQGEVWLARDHALFAGVNGDTREHAHYAHQLLLAETPLLERLFAVQVGLSVRRLVLWRRLYLAFALALQGRSLTEAAHHAGFADAAHLSRSVRSLLGIRAGLSLPHLRLAG